MKRTLIALAAVALIAAPAADVGAWGATGHRLIAVAAMRALPDEIPAFLRTTEAATEVGELAREPDRWKGGPRTHARERDTAHFIDFDDNGYVLTPQGPHIDAMPELRSEYEARLTQAGLSVDTAGWLYYALIDGWQQLVRDFAYWRVLNAAEARETDPARRAWYAEDRRRREGLLIRDLGVWSHYVGDASQPLHTSIHYNGWDRDTPNPEGFTRSRQTHGLFEGAYVRRVARLDTVEAAMPDADLGDAAIDRRTARYLGQSLVQVTPFYRLERDGAFNEGDARGAAFAVERLGAGAGELRDLIVMAWRESANARVGWPAVAVAEVEAGTADPWDAMIGTD
ncbi:MAG: S1/P1 Nuclease [Brevundimonas sp.]|uniref:S1/P1 Nuclease n=1 Tax=Brevundimonas sp. TaxID=1871086 RepID=UPI00391AE92C